MLLSELFPNFAPRNYEDSQKCGQLRRLIGKAILRSRTIRSSTGLFSLPYFYIFLSIVMALLFLNLLLDFVIDEEG